MLFLCEGMSNFLPKPIRKPILDTDLLRLIDTMIFGEQLLKLTQQELADARKTEPYRMLQRVGIAAYRAGEQALRPRPSLMAIKDQEPTPVKPEQHETAAP